MNFYTDTLEYLFIAIIIMGFLLAIFIRSAIVSYIIIISMGIMVGRLFYLKKKNLPFFRYMLTIGFLLGFLIGSFYANWLWLLFFFMVAAYASYKMHKHNLINDIE